MPYEGKKTQKIDGVPAEDRIWLSKCLKSNDFFDSPCINIFAHYPLLVPNNNKNINLALFFWEESLVPEDMIEILNLHYHGVLVATNFIKKILIDSGLKKPIQVIGAGEGLKQLANSTISTIKTKNTPFTFFHVSGCYPRKGVDVLLQAYVKEFTSKDNVKLLIKGFPNIHNDIEEQINSLSKSHQDLPLIEFINKDIPEEDLLLMYGKVDAVVLPARGEGLNFSAAEAMFLDKPLIITAYSGHLDFCNRHNTWMIDYHYEFSSSHFGKGTSVWANPDVDDLAKNMRLLFDQENQLKIKKIVESKIKMAKKNVKLFFDWSSVVDKTINFCARPGLSKSKGNKKVKLGWLSPWNTKCGIAEYSAFLLNEFNQNNMDITIYPLSNPEETSEGKKFNIKKYQKPHGNRSIKFLVQEVIEDMVDVLVIQYNFGFFHFADIAKYLESFVNANIQIIIVFHQTESLNQFKQTDIDQLKLCDRILVHTLQDMNRLKSYGLVDNVTYFPQGVINDNHNKAMVKIDDSIKNLKPFIIGSYGFFFPHKGIYQLISAFHEILKDIPGAKLILVNAEYPNTSSREEIERCIKHAKSLDIFQLIEWCTDFKTNSASLDKLHECDLLVYAYQNTAESSSAAVRLGLGSKKPVLTTPIPIFDEIKSIVYQTQGIEAKDIKESILTFYKDKENRHKFETQQKEWLVNHDWKILAKRMQGMIEGLVVNSNFFK